MEKVIRVVAFFDCQQAVPGFLRISVLNPVFVVMKA
jgi:hypothetical protein